MTKLWTLRVEEIEKGLRGMHPLTGVQHFLGVEILPVTALKSKVK